MKKKENKRTKDGLTIRMKLFCDWYIKLGGSRFGTQAAIKAGYSEKTAYSIASELLKKPDIQAYIEKRKHNLEDLLGFNKSTILEDLHEIKARSMQKVPVMVYNPKSRSYEQKMEEGNDGKKYGVWQYDSNGANRAVENINKMMGYNEPEKVEDVTPLEKKAPTVVIQKTYADKESSQSSD